MSNVERLLKDLRSILKDYEQLEYRKMRKFAATELKQGIIKEIDEFIERENEGDNHE